MLKKNNYLKLLKYYNFINYNLIYNNKAINRYKRGIFEISEDKAKIRTFKKSIINQKNCSLKNQAKILHLMMVIQNQNYAYRRGAGTYIKKDTACR